MANALLIEKFRLATVRLTKKAGGEFNVMYPKKYEIWQQYHDALMLISNRIHSGLTISIENKWDDPTGTFASDYIDSFRVPIAKKIIREAEKS